MAVEVRRAQRIFVIGGVGSGKTTFANRLAAITGLPVHHLDELTAEPARREPSVAAILASSGWIVEGVHLGWTDALLDSADLIVWLDHRNWWQNSAWIVRRFFREAIVEVGRQKGLKKFTRFGDYARHLKELALAIPDARHQQRGATAGSAGTPTRSEIALRLAPLHAKVIHCQDRPGRGIGSGKLSGPDRRQIAADQRTQALNVRPQLLAQAGGDFWIERRALLIPRVDRIPNSPT